MFAIYISSNNYIEYHFNVPFLGLLLYRIYHLELNKPKKSRGYLNNADYESIIVIMLKPCRSSSWHPVPDAKYKRI